MTQLSKVKCECADDLNFGEPQPDCSACGGTGRRPLDRKPSGPIFNNKTQLITTSETAEQIAERLLPCNCAVKPLCPTVYRPAIAAALRAKDERIGELQKITDNDLERVVHYRNLALELGAKPKQMLNRFDKDLAERWGKGQGYDAKEEIRDTELLWDENERLEAQVQAEREALTECRGKPHTSKSNELPHKTQIEMLQEAVQAERERALRWYRYLDPMDLYPEDEEAYQELRALAHPEENCPSSECPAHGTKAHQGA